VLHRDLKPANILLDRRGNVRITDFGLAALAGEAGQSWDVGTPIYMAPEQLRGEAISVQTDLYALGLVLYEIYTVKRPFTMESAAEAARSRQTFRLQPSGDLDPGLERVILPCLDPDPARRPRSATEVGSALMDFTIGLFRDSQKTDSSLSPSASSGSSSE
jgi:serine/threonine-protein kinase